MSLGDAVQTVDPATGETLATYPFTSDAEIDSVLDRASAGFAAWRNSTLEERSAVLRAIADALRAGVDRHAALISAEMGKPLAEAAAEIEKCAWACDFYAESGPGFLADEEVETEAKQSYVQYSPLGPVLAIMPWNYPFWQVMRFAAPTLMAGNSIVLKHAGNVTGSSLALAELMADVGLPTGTFEAVVVPGRRASDLIRDPRIAAVTLTGSEEVGAAVGAVAGESLKRAVLELGGSDAFVVCGDADVEAASAVAVRARFQNAGQSCIAAKRFIVVERVAEEFEERFSAAAAAIQVGDPREAGTEMGPMARVDLRDELAEQVARAIEAGGRVATGGGAANGPGAFFEPTIVSGVMPGTPLFDEETFGPVAALVRARDDEEAIRLANQSRFGLGFAIWTADTDRARALASSVEAGSVTVNGMTASDPRMPFGGVKRSGYGRELGIFGIREFVNVQGVTVSAG